MTTRERKVTMRWATYIDGFNFYHAVRDRAPGRPLYLGWCDFAKLSDRLVAGRGRVAAIKYFTARVEDFPRREGDADRQTTWLRAVKATKGVSIVQGFFIGERAGKYATKRSEKTTDVNLALTLLLDAAKQVYDYAILITGDYDQMPAVLAVTEEFCKTVEVWIPPGQAEGRWNEIANHPRVAIRKIEVEQLQGSLLPDTLVDSEGPILRPEKWRAPADA